MVFVDESNEVTGGFGIGVFAAGPGYAGAGRDWQPVNDWQNRIKRMSRFKKRGFKWMNICYDSGGREIHKNRLFC